MKLNATALLFASVCIVQSSFLSSQPVPKSRPPEFDHVALHVHNIQRSAAFYEKVMTLERLPEPFNEHSELFSKAGYFDVQVFEEYDKGWICAVGRKRG